MICITGATLRQCSAQWLKPQKNDGLLKNRTNYVLTVSIVSVANAVKNDVSYQWKPIDPYGTYLRFCAFVIYFCFSTGEATCF